MSRVLQYTRGGSRLQPVRQQMQQRQDGSQPYKGSQNEAGADSLCSEQSGDAFKSSCLPLQTHPFRSSMLEQ